MSSVSRVLSGHADVSPAMRDRVLAAVGQLGYEPDFLAQSLRRGATLSVGFVVGDISNPLIADIASGAEQALRESGYSMLVMNSENDPRLDAAHVRFFESRRVDGLILSLASERAPETLQALEDCKLPLVLVDRELPPQFRVSAVRNDHREGIRVATAALLDLGHRRIALVTGPEDIFPVRQRIAGLHDAVAERGIPDETLYRTGSLSAEHGDAATEALLAMDDPPTAIIAGGNQPLVGCLRAFARHGIRPGRDIALVTCDDVPLAQLYDPPISVVARDTVGLGREAAEVLLRHLRGDLVPRTVILPMSFELRPSSPAAVPR
jgi:LacI family transcriptional regulator